MFNPLLPDVSSLKDSELEAKILDLSRKYSIASRTGMNAVIPQILTSLEHYKTELNKRHQKTLQDLTKRSNGNLDDLINVE